MKFQRWIPIHIALLPFLALPASADLIISANTTWDLSVNPRVLTEPVRVQNGAILTILPGVIIKPQSALINLYIENGALDAQSVVFTSFKDDTRGGDTNGDGNATSPAPGDWGAIVFQSGTLSTQTLLDHCEIYYGNPIQLNDTKITLTYSTFSYLSNSALRFNGSSFLSGHHNYAIHNAVNGVDVTPTTLQQNGTWENIGFPYVIQNASLNIGNLKVLTLAPGTNLKFFGNAGVNGNGQLVAIGTNSEPITFTSLRDDSAGGDTNEGEGIISPARGDWTGINTNNGFTQIVECRLRYGGKFSVAEVSVNGSATVRNSVIEHSLGNGVNVSNSPLIEGCTIQFITTFGVWTNGTVEPASIRNNVIRNVDNIGVVINASAAEVSGNMVVNNNSGFWIVGTGTPLIANNQFGNNLSGMLDIGSSNVFPQQLGTNIIISSNGVNGIRISLSGDQMTQSGAWDSTTLPYYLISQLTVAANATLTIQSGVVVKYGINGNNIGRINAVGPLYVQGTPENPVIFTSGQDDTALGDTNNDGNATVPAPGDWPALVINYNGGVVSHAVFRYGGYAGGSELEFTPGSGPLVQYSTFTLSGAVGLRATQAFPIVHHCVFSSMPTGVYLTDNSTINISHSTFSVTGTAISNQSPVTVDARHNWWGASSGPLDNSDDRPTGGYFNPEGTGNPVTNYVNYNPWLGITVLANPELSILEGEIVSGPLVHLELGVEGPVTQMRIAESLSFPGTWIPFSPEQTWTLSEGDGLKTVYAQFRAADGSVSEIAEQTINLQTAPPSAAIAISSSQPVGVGTIQITLTASETLQDLPLLTLTPYEDETSTISLTTSNYLVFHGSFTIDSNTGSGPAVFQFTGVDLSTTVGTEITSGASFEIDTLAPEPPVVYDPIPLQSGAISLSWSTSNEPLPRYTVARATEPVTEQTANTLIASDISTTTLVHTPPEDGLYYFAVKTRDLANNLGEFSNVVSTISDRTPPLPVPLISAVLNPDQSVEINWQMPSGDPPAAYRLYRAPSSTPTVNPQNLLVETTNQFHQDTLNESGLYYYGATTLDALENESGIIVSSSVYLDITPPSVANVQLTPPAPIKLGPLTIVLTFSESLNTQKPAPQVVLIASGAPNGLVISSTSFNGPTWTGLLIISTNVSEGTAALSVSGGEDLYGNPLTTATFYYSVDYTAPSVPQNVMASAVGNGTDVFITWTPPEPNCTFSVFRSTNNRITWNVAGTGISTNSFKDQPPALSTSVFYAVNAKDQAQNQSPLSSYANVSSPFSPLIISPVYGTHVSSPGVVLSGRAQVGTTVRVYFSSGTLLSTCQTNINSEFSTTITLPLEGENEIYAVAEGPSTYFSPAGNLHQLILNSLPLMVQTPQAEAGDTTITLTWSGNPEPDIAGYWVYRDGQLIPLNAVRIDAAPNLEFQDTGLTNGRSYSYRIAAEDAAAQLGPKSEPVNQSPAAGPEWTLAP